MKSKDEAINTEVKTERVPCNLCGSDSSDDILLGRDMLHGLPGEWSVVRCRECGLVYTNPRPTLETLASVYPSDYGPYQAQQHKRHRLRRRLQQWAMRQHWNYPPHDKGGWLSRLLSWPVLILTKGQRRNFDLFPWQGQGKLLDYGCGSGGYLDRMKQWGWNVVGMDMSDQAVAACREQGFDVYRGIAPDQEFEPESFDVVTLWHVLEHVPSPTRTLCQVNTVLKPHGKLVVALPNIDSLLARWLGIYWYPLELPRHLTHFSKTTITKMMEKAGFRVEKIYAQRYGQVTQKSFRYLTREKKKGIIAILSRRRRLCSIIERILSLNGEPPRMVVHARKI